MDEEVVNEKLTEEQIKYLESTNNIWKYNMALKFGYLCLGKNDYLEFKNQGIILTIKKNKLRAFVDWWISIWE